MRSSWLLLKVVDNVLRHPGEAKYERVRVTSDAVRAVVAMPAVADVFAALGFVLDGEHYVLQAPDPARLQVAFDALVALRRSFDAIEAYELFAVRF